MYKIKNKKVFKKPKTPKRERLVKNVDTDKITCERDECSEFMALMETKRKPDIKITDHKYIFD